MLLNWPIIAKDLKQALLHRRVRQLSKRDWRKRHTKVFHLNPDYRKPAPPAIEKAHLELWRPLRRDISLDTLRVCYGVSGKACAEIIPEELYVSEIEPCLNRCREAAYLANKNFYNRWFPSEIFPRPFLHNIDGDFYDGQYQPLPPSEVETLVRHLPYPVVLKPSLGPGGGRGVQFVRDPDTLLAALRGKSNLVVQELIHQHPFFSQFNNTCLNTLRVCTYRSVRDNRVHVLNITMRMGKGGSLDNETAGGIVCNIHDDGTLNHYALDKYAVKFTEHPDTHIRFDAGHVVPQLDELRSLAVRVAQDVYLTRLTSLDATLDDTGRWRLIEINLYGQTIRFAQYAGKPFFGRFTEEVIEYCKQHPDWR